MTKSILLTGSNGFTGKALSSALSARGFVVIELSGPKSEAPGRISCDLNDRDALFRALNEVQVDCVIHLAAISFVASADAQALYRTNVVGTCNLLDVMADKRPKQVIIASSANVYGVPISSAPISEESPLLPVNHYACSKLAMEHMARTFQGLLPLAIVRPFNYTGVGQEDHFLIPKIVMHFAKKAPFIELGNLDISRDFTGIDDVVSAYLALIDSHIHGETLNISSGVSISLREIIDELRQLSGHDLEVRRNPGFMRSTDIRTLCGDSGKLQNLTGWKITQPIRAILRSMLDAASGG